MNVQRENTLFLFLRILIHGLYSEVECLVYPKGYIKNYLLQNLTLYQKWVVSHRALHFWTDSFQKCCYVQMRWMEQRLNFLTGHYLPLIFHLLTSASREKKHWNLITDKNLSLPWYMRPKYEQVNLYSTEGRSTKLSK